VKTEAVSVGELLNDPANVRLHGARNLETIKASLARFGQQKPIVVDGNGVVVAGNGTLAAARELGWQEVHVVRSALTGSDRTAYAIADNRTAELAEWDDGALAEQLSALAIDDEELLAAAGYDPGELEALADSVVGGGGEVVEDEAPEPPADPVTKPGDLWQLGEHRVLCGDSTKAEDVDRLLGGAVVDATITDPPYGISYQSNHRKDKFDELENDDRILSGWVAPSMRASRGWIVFFCAWQRLDDWMEVGREIGDLTNLLIWKKAAAMGDLTGSFAATFEVALAYNRGEKLLCDGRPSAVLEHRIDAGVTFKHPTTKPVGLLADILRATTRKCVFDPFLGSGTTLIAAEQLGRRCYGIEISPAYCDVIVERWENLTGGKAKRVADG
jgi:DNA modification methylase